MEPEVSNLSQVPVKERKDSSVKAPSESNLSQTPFDDNENSKVKTPGEGDLPKSPFEDSEESKVKAPGKSDLSETPFDDENSKDKSSTERSEWRKLAIEKQQVYFNTIGDKKWEVFEDNSEDDLLCLTIKIGFILFGPPTMDDIAYLHLQEEEALQEAGLVQIDPDANLGQNIPNESLGQNDPNESLNQNDPNEIEPDFTRDFGLIYSQPYKKRKINDIIERIRLLSGGSRLNIGFLFIIANINNPYTEFPLIRVLCDKDKAAKFIDCTGRCYSTWDNFLNENKFPECEYCYPRDGFYSSNGNGHVAVEFGLSPETQLLRRSGKIGDIASGAMSIGCTTILFGSLMMPVSSPAVFLASLLFTTAGAWNVGRAAYKLADKTIHMEDLTDEEASQYWLDIATGILGVASAGSTKQIQCLVKNKKAISTLRARIAHGIDLATLSVSGIKIFSHLNTMYEKKEFNIDDIAGFAVSLMFFCNIAVSFKTSEQLLEYNKTLNNDFSSKLQGNKEVLNKLIKTVVKKDESEGNTHAIKTVLNTNDPNKPDL